MNDLQRGRDIIVKYAKMRVHKLEHKLAEARLELQTAERFLQEAIDADRESWHNTPGIIK